MAIDNDIGNNSLVQYHIVTIRYFQSQSNGSEDVGSIFTIGMYNIQAVSACLVQHTGQIYLLYALCLMLDRFFTCYNKDLI